LGEDGEKMSKSRGNVVAPDALVDQYGADTVRAYLMFFARWEQGGPWNYDGIKGPQRLLYDVWDVATRDYQPKKVDQSADRTLHRKTHQTIRKVTEDMESFSFNTAVAAIMEFRNAITDAQKTANVATETWDEAVNNLLLLLAPISPHITEELWEQRGRPYSIHRQPWPQWDAEAVKEDTIELVVQVNGRVRDKLEVPVGTNDEALKQLALASEKAQIWMEGKEPRKVIVVRGRLVNIVV
jgi:leucyl-tRNA synthetase